MSDLSHSFVFLRTATILKQSFSLATHTSQAQSLQITPTELFERRMILPYMKLSRTLLRGELTFLEILQKKLKKNHPVRSANFADDATTEHNLLAIKHSGLSGSDSPLCFFECDAHGI